MTKEDRNLLLIDICARLPYNVKVCYDNKVCTVDAFAGNSFIISETPDTAAIIAYPEDIKPYLLPLSSMSESQKQEFFKIAGYEMREEDCGRHTEMYYYDLVGHENTLCPNYDAIDWLNAHHFDYRGLINKGLAIDATNLNIY